MDGSDCRGYRTTRRNLPSSIAYRPPFTAISRNIGVIDMQTSHTTASAAATTSLARRIVAASWKPVLFAVLMWLSAAAGEIPIPGTPVPITLQTFAITLAAKAGFVAAVDLNPRAVGLMLTNLSRNRVRNVLPLLADARRLARVLPWQFDRIVMNLPLAGTEFLPEAFRLIRPGGIIAL